MSGILVTCARNQEARCTSEASQLLDTVIAQSSYETDQTEQQDEHVSFADEIAKEVAELKNVRGRPYKAIGLGDATCMVFLKLSPINDPVSMVSKLFEESQNGTCTATR